MRIHETKRIKTRIFLKLYEFDARLSAVLYKADGNRGRVYHNAMLQSFIGGTVTVIEDHEIVMVHLISYDSSPRLLDRIYDLVLESQIKTRRREAEDMRRMGVKSRRRTVVTEPSHLMILHGPEHDGLRTLCSEQTVHRTFE
jgi:hypothetical protein